MSFLGKQYLEIIVVISDLWRELSASFKTEVK
jgi:hypothetical protein